MKMTFFRVSCACVCFANIIMAIDLDFVRDQDNVDDFLNGVAPELFRMQRAYLDPKPSAHSASSMTQPSGGYPSNGQPQYSHADHSPRSDPHSQPLQNHPNYLQFLQQPPQYQRHPERKHDEGMMNFVRDQDNVNDLLNEVAQELFLMERAEQHPPFQHQPQQYQANIEGQQIPDNSQYQPPIHQSQSQQYQQQTQSQQPLLPHQPQLQLQQYQPQPQYTQPQSYHSEPQQYQPQVLPYQPEAPYHQPQPLHYNPRPPIYQPPPPQYQPETPPHQPQPPQYLPETPPHQPQPPQYLPETPPHQPQPPQYRPETPPHQPQPQQYQPERPAHQPQPQQYQLETPPDFPHFPQPHPQYSPQEYQPMEPPGNVPDYKPRPPLYGDPTPYNSPAQPQYQASPLMGGPEGKSRQIYQPTPARYSPIVKKSAKKQKIISINKGTYIAGGSQAHGKFRNLRDCMQACSVTAMCFAGDYNPWQSKCYFHSNVTACGMLSSHPKLIHFKKVPCDAVSAPRGRVFLGSHIPGGIFIKGVKSLMDCVKKCSQAGNGIAPSPAALLTNLQGGQRCLGVDYDFGTHSCYFHTNLFSTVGVTHPLCPTAAGQVIPVPLHLSPAGAVVSILLCPA